jgi:hypothetical protein
MEPETFYEECKKIYCLHDGRYDTTEDEGDTWVEKSGTHIHLRYQDEETGEWHDGDEEDSHFAFDELCWKALSEAGFEKGIKYVLDEIDPQMYWS